MSNVDYKVYLTDGSIETVSANRFEQDGSGLRLFDDNDQMVASYRDGEYRRCSKASNTVETPQVPEIPEGE